MNTISVSSDDRNLFKSAKNINIKTMKNILTVVILMGLMISTVHIATAQGCSEPSSDDGVQVFGYLQPELNFHFENETTAAFQFRRMRIGVMGAVPYDFSYYVLLETSQFVNPDKTGAFLLDAFVTYNRFRNFKVSVGSFKYRFGRELSMACHSLYTIRRSKTVDELTANFNGGNRDLGIMFLGGNDTTLVTYQVSLTNGYGVLNTEKNDLLRAFSLNGRLTLQPIPGLYLGASARYSKSPSSDINITDDDTKIRYGFDAEYRYKNFTIFGEYIDGDDQGSYTEGGGCDGDPVTKTGFQYADGFYVMGLYRFGKLEPVYKFENYSTQKGEVGVEGSTDASSFCHTFGLNFYPNDWTRIQANYIYASEDPAEINNDALLIQFQVKF
jgi:phosphate-selective porin